MRMTGNGAILSNRVPIVANEHLDIPSNPIRPNGANYRSPGQSNASPRESTPTRDQSPNGAA